jgi:hypothetical protein
VIKSEPFPAWALWGWACKGLKGTYSCMRRFLYARADFCMYGVHEETGLGQGAWERAWGGGRVGGVRLQLGKRAWEEDAGGLLLCGGLTQQTKRPEQMKLARLGSSWSIVSMAGTPPGAFT